MIIKILPKQIPVFWDAIKYTAVQVDEVDSKDMQPYLNELLHALLSNKAQCFVHLTDERILDVILITRILVDKIKEEKYLSIESIFSWTQQNGKTWNEGVEIILRFAKQQGCKYIQGRSRQERVKRLVKSLGFIERFTVFDLQLG